jgi:hypothetical protein
MYDETVTVPRRSVMPELEYRAAEALFEQVPVLRRQVREIASFIEATRGRVRDALRPDIRQLPEPEPLLTLRTAAVDSSHSTLSTAGMTVVFCAAFRTSASNSEDHRFALAPLDAGFEVEPVARLMRCHMEAELLCYERQGEDQITILDNRSCRCPPRRHRHGRCLATARRDR